MRFLSKDLKNEFDTAVIIEPSVFKPLKFYCISQYISESHGKQIANLLLEIIEICFFV